MHTVMGPMFQLVRTAGQNNKSGIQKSFPVLFTALCKNPGGPCGTMATNVLLSIDVPFQSFPQLIDDQSKKNLLTHHHPGIRLH